ncbi:hypothetical protein Tco_0925474 [Tanacetum coccineum]|uniref:Uncharacterized protein n=1 Tax=Tanacetum coccineum TaxID=301880 RepID=A0ABQ5D6Z8_9ASTR
MANQEQIPPQQEQPFVAAKQVSFNLEDIILNTNNEVALLYPEHTNKYYFKCVSDFISKCFLRKPFTRSPDMYKEYLAEFWYSPTALENSKVSFSRPTGGIFGEVWGIGLAKGTLKKSLFPSRWRLLMAQIIQCLGGKTGGFDQITNKDAIILYSLANGINIDYANIFWEDIILKLKKKQREKVVPYTRFISLLIMHKIKEGHGDDEVIEQVAVRSGMDSKMVELYSNPIALIANSPTLDNPSQSPQHSGSLVYPPPQKFTPVYATPIHHHQHPTLVNPIQQLVSPLQYISLSVTQQPQTEFSLAVPMCQQGEYPIECINKVMAFPPVVASRFPPSNNQLRMSSNPHNQATIQDGRVIVQQVQGKKIRVLLAMEIEEVL